MLDTVVRILINAVALVVAAKIVPDIHLTIGDALRINAGTGSGAFARLQTASRDSQIDIYFPNLASGGYFVNGVEGALRRGLTGILAGDGVATPGHILFVTYGQ